MTNIWLALITGLTTGGISCLAVQGGLLASSVSQSESEVSSKARSVGAFLVTKLVAYSTLGALLGLVGSKIIISPTLQGWVQIFVGLFLLITAARILKLHPIFRYFVIQPPKFLLRLVRNASRNSSYFGPAFLGFLTILIPCGVTQAMMILAVSTKSPVFGAGIMAAFTLGTSPIFFALGLAADQLLKRKALSYVAVGVIALLGVQSINAGQALRGSVHTLQNYYKAATAGFDQSGTASAKVAGLNSQGKQEATINVTKSGYSSNVTTLKAGVPVNLSLVTNNAGGCTRAFTIPSLGISKILPVNGTETLEFTPTKTGKLAFTCSMGMYTGFFEVIDS